MFQIDTGSQHGAGESPSRHNAARSDSVMTHMSVSERRAARQDSNMSVSGRKASRQMSAAVGGPNSLSGSIPGTLYASSFDLTNTMAKNDYFR